MKEKNDSVIYVNGTIITVDSNNRIAQALAVKDDKILAVGSNEQILSLANPDTKVVDLAGKTMIPGFYDAHGHFSNTGESLLKVDLTSPPVGKRKCIADYIAALRKKAQETPLGEWIFGYGYDDTLIDEMRQPTKYDLDQVSTEHPIWITHVSGHMGVANSKALEIAEITRNTIAPEGGVISKDTATGEPNGLLEERAMWLLGNLNVDLPQEQRFNLFVQTSKLYAEAGVTTATDGLVESVQLINDYKKGAEEKKLGIRVLINPTYDIAEAAQKINLRNGMLTMGGVKMIFDGSIQVYTAYLSKPYYKTGKYAADHRGYCSINQERLSAYVKKVHNAGLQCVIHGNGDAAIDEILQAYQAAQEENPRLDSRHLIIHCQTAREDQLDKIKALGVIPSFFALHTYYWGDRHRDTFLGPERALRIDPCKSAADRGIPFTIHCDTPVVPQNPLLSMYAAVNRISYKGNVIGEEQRVTPLEALKAVTIYSAYQNFEEDSKGSLEPGKLADLVILEQSPLHCAPENIKDIRVLETIVGGETVYRASV